LKTKSIIEFYAQTRSILELISTSNSTTKVKRSV
jgi:hypothetical protein